MRELNGSSCVEKYESLMESSRETEYSANSPRGTRSIGTFDKRNAAIDNEKEEPLKSSRLMDGLGETEEEALVVVVPSSRSSSRSTSASSLTGKEPNPKRLQRWIELNEILEGSAKKTKTNDSTAYSNVTWNQVKTVFSPTNYVQTRRNIDDAQLSFLAQYLSITTKCFGDTTTGKEAKRLHFIAPVLICVCILLDGDVDIVFEEIWRGYKAVCIVEAKKDDVEQGMAQDLVGCEVAAEVGGLDIVYGIVTNYIQWNFLRSLDDKVEKEECSLRIPPNGPERESLKEIAEKIYGMLSSSKVKS
ncbi:hypothetical protein HDU67_008410, partial [Dinochytrium kinnereticum]